MQGLPIHQLQKSTQGTVKSSSVDTSKAAQALQGESSNVESALGEFASLFAGLSGKLGEGKASQVQSQTGETLKNLLADKKTDKSAEGKTNVAEAMAGSQLTSQAISQAMSQVNTEQVMSQANPEQAIVQAKGKNAQTAIPSEGKLEQKIANTKNGLDQLLNNLKGTQDHQVLEESEENSEITPQQLKSINPNKIESKNESPLDFLVKGTKSKGVSLDAEAAPVQAQKQVVTGEDFIKMQTKDIRPQLAVINGQKGEDLQPALKLNQNAKVYSQGMNLMNDSLIKNTKDFANKDLKKGKQSLMGVDELLTKDMKASAELATIRQEAVPGLQNNKDNHGQQNLHANSNQKVLDLSHISTSNTTEIIKKISDYALQNNVAGKQSLDLTVKHESLGEFKIQVTKVPESMNRGLNQIDMQITTSSKEGHDFFVKNEVNLMKNLNQSGINLSDLRIVSSMSESTAFGQSDSKQSSSFSQNPDGSKQFSSFESKSFTGEGGSQRRKELWEEYQQRYGA